MGRWAAGRVVAATAAALFTSAGFAAADHPQPAPDISRVDYTPIGLFKPGDAVPSPTTPPAESNPSGKYVAYDTNVFESLNLPQRQPGDESASDPPGTGDPRHGFCPPDPEFFPWGKCSNHQLEYLDYFERTMRDLLGDFGVVIHRYQFTSPGAGLPRGAPFAAPGGRAINISATIPGADHPEESVLVSGHYDFTDSGPAAAWDSAEGHAEVIRMAKIMSDYWRATGTRPSATVKFIPWDSEESGTWGSADYVENNIPPGEEDQVRGYFNVDPCAGGYPAYKYGAPPNRIPQVVQLADPEAWPEDSPERRRIEAFNARAANPAGQSDILDEIFAHMDANDPGLQLVPGGDPEEQIFTPEQRENDVVTAVGGLALFTSDYGNFEAVGIPIFNFFPDVFGPKADPTANDPRSSSDGVTILHTPRDNLTTINHLTGAAQANPDGTRVAEGWAKGMEMCAQVESWYMLQPEMGGGQTSNTDVVAYYEALPNEAIQRQRVRFDASGSYQYSSVLTRGKVDDSQLSYSWDFGDGTTGSGRVVEHAYDRVGRYQSRLTVRNTATGASDTMELPIEVVPSDFPGPVLERPPAEDADGNFGLRWTFDGSRSGFREFAVEEATDFQRLLFDDAEGDINRLWAPSATPDPRVHDWQRSDGSPALNGNQRHSGESSYWTGAFPTSPSPTNQESILTLKAPIAVPTSGEPVLSYFSLFQNESDDEGRVEVAIDDGDPSTPEHFEPIDGIGGLFSPTEPEGIVGPELELRKVSLARFRGRRILIRFRYILGPNDPAASQPAGWYVDDILVESGTWSRIGTTTARDFQVFGKTAGTYGYRIKAVYDDELESSPSNAEQVRVTRGVVRPGGGPGEPGAEAGCAPGFRSVAARPRGRGLSFRVRRRVRRPFDVTVYQQSRGRSIVRNRRVARFRNRTRSFSWTPRRRLAGGFYFARFSIDRPDRGRENRDRALQRSRGRFRRRADFQRREACGLLRSFRLSRSVFGGRQGRPLGAAFQLSGDAQVSITVTRGRTRVLTMSSSPRLGGVNYKFRLLVARLLRRGDYRVTITIRRGNSTVRSRLVARRL